MADDAAVEIRHDEDESRFEATSAGAVVGELVYARRGERFIILHTEVNDALEGHGVGAALVKAALKYAREEGLTVVPRCPFARAYIERHPEYRPLLGT